MGAFATTRWSLILQARRDSLGAADALEQICRAYRAPALAYVRRRTHGSRDAEDLVQEFFTRFLAQRWHAAADPERGRFRTFLLTSLQRFLCNAFEEAQAAKRGGGAAHVALDEMVVAPAAPTESPEEVFDRTWALTVLERALSRLEAEARGAGRLTLFRRLSEFLTESPDPEQYARLASELGMRSNTLAVAVHRLRQRLRALVREELAQTVSDPNGLEHELQFLRAALASRGASA